MDNYNRERDIIDKSNVTVNNLDIMVSAMWELMLEKGFTREQMNAKLDKIIEQKTTLDPQQSTIVCSTCGKVIGESQKTPFEAKCLYCGNTTKIYPGDSITFNKDNSSLSDNSSSTFDDLDLF